jgi:hypothetical protein
MIRETFDRVGDAMAWLERYHNCAVFRTTDGHAIAGYEAVDEAIVACIYETVRGIEVEVYDR